MNSPLVAWRDWSRERKFRFLAGLNFIALGLAHFFFPQVHQSARICMGVAWVCIGVGYVMGWAADAQGARIHAQTMPRTWALVAGMAVGAMICAVLMFVLDVA